MDNGDGRSDYDQAASNCLEITLVIIYVLLKKTLTCISKRTEKLTRKFTDFLAMHREFNHSRLQKTDPYPKKVLRYFMHYALHENVQLTNK